LHRGFVVEPIDGGAVPTRHEMSVGVDGDLDRRVAHLVFHVGEALAVVDEERREGVTLMPRAA
jgi:hypothetical protein